MKFAIKSLAVAAAMVAAGSSYAAQTISNLTVGGPALTVTDPYGSGRTAQFKVISASGNLAFSNGTADPFNVNGNPDNMGGAISALNVGNIVLQAGGGLSVSEFNAPDAFGDSIRVRAISGGSVDRVSVITGDTTNPAAVGALQFAYTPTGSTVTQSAVRLKGVANGGFAAVNNIRFDIAGGRVIADVNAQAAPVGTTTYAPVSVSNMVLWTFDAPGTTGGTYQPGMTSDVVGPTGIDPLDILSTTPVADLTAAGFTLLGQAPGDSPGFTKYTVGARTTITDLQITQAGVDFFSAAFGLQTVGSDALKGVNRSLINPNGFWGTVVSDFVFEVQEVPEPSTYALMGLGLVGISLVARRRRAA